MHCGGKRFACSGYRPVTRQMKRRCRVRLRPSRSSFIQTVTAVTRPTPPRGAPIAARLRICTRGPAVCRRRFAEVSAARDLLLQPPPPPEARGHWQHAASAASAAAKSELRAFRGDVTDDVCEGRLGGSEAAQLFREHKLWAVWVCNHCDLVCCRIRAPPARPPDLHLREISRLVRDDVAGKEKYSCACGHRLRDHDAARGFRCTEPGCRCDRFVWAVQFDFEKIKCTCKHGPADHAPPRGGRWGACTRPGCDCKEFVSPWVCNCGHPWSDHRTAFVRHAYTPRCREWVAPGLRPETVALASKFRARSPNTRREFIRRANAARAAGAPSYKAMVREARRAAALCPGELDAEPSADPDANDSQSVQADQDHADGPTSSEAGATEPSEAAQGEAEPPPSAASRASPPDAARPMATRKLL